MTDPDFAPPKWRSIHSMAASEQGWNIFDSDTRGLEIQRDDEEAIFASDEAAVEFVNARAAAGDKLAQRALDYLAYQRGLSAVLDGL